MRLLFVELVLAAVGSMNPSLPQPQGSCKKKTPGLKNTKILAGNHDHVWATINTFDSSTQSQSTPQDYRRGGRAQNTGPFGDAYLPTSFEESQEDANLHAFLKVENLSVEIQRLP